MKSVSLHIIYLLLALLAIAFILENLFTYGHYNFVPRTPVDWVMSMDSQDSVDYVILGSSRSLNNLDPVQIEQLTGRRGINLGLYDGQPFDSKLFVQQLIKRKITKSIYIQIDDSWNNTAVSNKAVAGWLPFLKEDDIWKEFEKIDCKTYFYLRKLPFYKYAKYDSEIGFRDYIKGLTGQELRHKNSIGFISIPSNNTIEKEKRSLPYDFTLRDEPNPHITEILKLCEQNGIDVTFFTSPIFNATGDHSLLKKYLPNYVDFTHLIKNPEFFADHRHLNAKGVAYFGENIYRIFEK